MLVGAETKHVETVMLERGKAQDVALANRKIAKKNNEFFFGGDRLYMMIAAWLVVSFHPYFFMLIPILGEINPI